MPTSTIDLPATSERHQIASNKYYDLSIDTNKNRIYIKVKGFWPDPYVVPDYITHWEQVLTMVKPDFTVLADCRAMVTHPMSVVKVHQKTMDMSKANGHLESAQIFSDEIAEWQIEQIGRKSSVNKNKFTSMQQAEAFLDEAVAKKRL